MAVSWGTVFDLARFTAQNPKAGARHVLDLRLPISARWGLLALVASVSAILTHVSFALLPADDQMFMADAMASPLRTALMQAVLLLVTTAAIYRLGRWRGGTGNFADSLLLVGWLQFILICVQVAQLAALMIFAPLAEIIGILGLGLSFWLLTQFIMELHGFRSAWRVFFSIILALFAAAFSISMVLVALVGPGV